MPIDVDVVIGRLGPKLEWELAQWFPADQVDADVRALPRHYWDHCVGDGTLSARRRARRRSTRCAARDGRVIVVTAKSEPLALPLPRVGRARGRRGRRSRARRREARRAHRARRRDLRRRHRHRRPSRRSTRRRIAVGVTTGPDDARTLLAAGADVVLDSLDEFPRLARDDQLSGADEQREAAPAPQTVDLLQARVAHPPELGLDVDEAIFGIVFGSPDRRAERRVQLGRRRRDDLEVCEHAAGPKLLARPRRTARACGRRRGGGSRSPRPRVERAERRRGRRRGRTRRRRTRASAANRARAFVEHRRRASTATTSVTPGRASSTSAASRPSPQPRSATRSGLGRQHFDEHRLAREPRREATDPVAGTRRPWRDRASRLARRRRASRRSCST